MSINFLNESLRSRTGSITDVDQLFDLQILTRQPLGPTSRQGRKIKIHNSIIWIWGREHAILREKLYRVLGSRSWNHGLNGELCPEHFQKGPRIFCFFWGGSLCGRSVGRSGGQSGGRAVGGKGDYFSRFRHDPLQHAHTQAHTYF